ncbi:hypothetical protein BROUX41_005389 [Berkeleyomyces rouxiae]|uniref:uncharacterized protein n=1 Tax=Berkeleyomyces rouxiae TaxID=2035830 RepID=UPI003B771C07
MDTAHQPVKSHVQEQPEMQAPVPSSAAVSHVDVAVLAAVAEASPTPVLSVPATEAPGATLPAKPAELPAPVLTAAIAAPPETPDVVASSVPVAQDAALDHARTEAASVLSTPRVVIDQQQQQQQEHHNQQQQQLQEPQQQQVPIFNMAPAPTPEMMSSAMSSQRPMQNMSPTPQSPFQSHHISHTQYVQLTPEQQQQQHVEALRSQALAHAQVQAAANAHARAQAEAQHAHSQSHMQNQLQSQAQSQLQGHMAEQISGQDGMAPPSVMIPAPAHPYLPNDPTGRSVPANPYHPLIGHSFENIKDARKALDAYAESAGYKMCVMKTLPTAVVWRCSQNGRRRTRPPTNTHPSKQRKHRLKERSGCRWKIRAVKRPRLRDGDGADPPAVEWIWTIRESDNPDARTHNHEMMDPASFASYRMKAAVSVKDIIFTMVDAGVKPIHIVAELKGRAKALNRPALSSIKSRDIHNLVQARKQRGDGGVGTGLSNEIDMDLAMGNRGDDGNHDADDGEDDMDDHTDVDEDSMMHQQSAQHQPQPQPQEPQQQPQQQGEIRQHATNVGTGVVAQIDAEAAAAAVAAAVVMDPGLQHAQVGSS